MRSAGEQINMERMNDYRGLPNMKDELLPDFQPPPDSYFPSDDHQHDQIYSQPLRWRKIIHTDGNTPRSRHGHRSLIVSNNLFIFGGGNEGIVDDMTVYNIDTNRWSTPQCRGEKIPGAAAAGFCRGSMNNSNKLYTFGGMIEYGRYSSELCELDLTRWEWKRLRTKSRSGSSPCPRLGHSFVSDNDGMIYLFGGLVNSSDDPRTNTPKYLNDLYMIKPSSSNTEIYWEIPRVTGPVPGPRESHTAVVYESGDRKEMIIYGGMDGSRLDDIWILDLKKMEWRQALTRGTAPLPRSLHSSILVGDRMYIFGGWVPIQQVLEDEQAEGKRWKCSDELCVLNVKTMTWEKAKFDYNEQNLNGNESHPKARAGHSAAFANNRIYIWSGRDGYRRSYNNQVCCKDFWYLELEKPGQAYKISLIRAAEKSLEITWSPIHNAEAYIVQICKPNPANCKVSSPSKQGPRTSQGAITSQSAIKTGAKTIIVPGRNGQQARTLVFPQSAPSSSESQGMSDEVPENFMEETPEESAKQPEQQADEPPEEQMQEEPPEEDIWFDVGIVKGNKFNISEYIVPGDAYQNIGSDYARNYDLDGYKNEEQNRTTEQLYAGIHYKVRVCGINLLGQGKWCEGTLFKTALPGFPGAPSQIKIQKCPEGASVQWEPPLVANGIISEYSVYLAVKSNATVQTAPGVKTSQGVEFYRCYVGLENSCVVPQVNIEEAHVETGKHKPAIIFRIAAKNEKGYGPATQVRWLQDNFSRGDEPSPIQPTQPTQPTPPQYIPRGPAMIQNRPIVASRPLGANPVATVRQQQIRPVQQSIPSMRQPGPGGVSMVYRPASNSQPGARYVPYQMPSQGTRVGPPPPQPPHRLIPRPQPLQQQHQPRQQQPE